MARLGQNAAGGRCGDGFGAGAGFFLDCRLNSAKGRKGLGGTSARICTCPCVLIARRVAKRSATRASSLSSTITNRHASHISSERMFALTTQMA
jgi:hypothetical protein